MRQSKSFVAREGDAFFQRNRPLEPDLETRVENDYVVRQLEASGIDPRRVLEIGSYIGWRLAWLRRQDPARLVVGVEGSAMALRDGVSLYPEVGHTRAAAAKLPLAARQFDVVILGHLLYVLDRDDLFRVAAEVDRVITRDGYVVIHDFYAEVPYRNPYLDRPGHYSYKMDYASMFSWNPTYRRVDHFVGCHQGGDPSNPDDRVAVTILRRDPDGAYVDGVPASPEWTPGEVS